MLSLLLGIRGVNIGIDTNSYYKIFELVNDVDSPYELRYEGLFIFINKLFHDVGFGAKTVILLFSVVTVFFISYFIRVFSPSLGLSLILYISAFGYFFAFNGLRQALA